MGLKFEPTVNITTVIAVLGMLAGGMGIYVDGVKTNAHQDDVIGALSETVRALGKTIDDKTSVIPAMQTIITQTSVRMNSIEDRQDRFSDFAKGVNDKLSSVSTGIAEIKGRLGIPSSSYLPPSIPPPLLRRSG